MHGGIAAATTIASLPVCPASSTRYLRPSQPQLRGGGCATTSASSPPPLRNRSFGTLGLAQKKGRATHVVDGTPRPLVSAAAAAPAAMATWTVGVWTAESFGADGGAGGGVPLAPSPWERPLVTPDIKLVRGCGRKGGKGSAAANTEVAGNPGGTDDDNLSTFDETAYFAALRTRSDGHQLWTAKALPSTQTVLQDNAAASAISPGVVCVADAQVRGRGRGGNTWTSPPGCLMFSMLTTHAEGRTLPFLQYVATMAAVEAGMYSTTLASFAFALNIPPSARRPPTA